MKQQSISLQELKERLAYDPETGVFTWLKPKHRSALTGREAGSVQGTGYRAINFSRMPVACHRLAWFYMTGEWPSQAIDHLNGIRLDNRWANLRLATAAINAQNISRANKNNRVGIRGVSPHQGGFRARIHTAGRTFYLGVFETQEAAERAYLNAKATHHQGAAA